jgi:hypothetical protein
MYIIGKNGSIYERWFGKDVAERSHALFKTLQHISEGTEKKNATNPEESIYGMRFERNNSRKLLEVAHPQPALPNSRLYS